MPLNVYFSDESFTNARADKQGVASVVCKREKTEKSSRKLTKAQKKSNNNKKKKRTVKGSRTFQ